MINIFHSLRNRELTGRLDLLYKGDCERCFYYWNLSPESRSEGQKTWISGRIHRIGTRSTTRKEFHCIRIDQSDRRNEHAFRACPELKGTGYNNLIVCRRYNMCSPSHLYVVA